MNNDPIIEELLSIKKYLEIVNDCYISRHLSGVCEKGWVDHRDPDKDYYLWKYYPVIEIPASLQNSLPIKDGYLNDFLNSYKEEYERYKDTYRENVFNQNKAPTEDDKLWLAKKISEWRKNVISDYSKTEHIRRLVWSLGDKYHESRRTFIEWNAEYYISGRGQVDFNEFHAYGMNFEIISRGYNSTRVKLKAMDGLWGGYPNYGRHEPILPNSPSLRIPKTIYKEGLGICYIAEIGAGVFDFLSHVETLYLPYLSKVEWSLWECFQLKNIHMEYDYDVHNYYRTIDGVLFSGDAKTLIAYPNKHGEEYEVPKGVERINKKAFKDCIDLKVLKLPSTIKSIGLNAFYRCENLKSIIVDKKEGTIDYEGLYGNFGDVKPEWIWIGYGRLDIKQT